MGRQLGPGGVPTGQGPAPQGPQPGAQPTGPGNTRPGGSAPSPPTAPFAPPSGPTTQPDTNPLNRLVPPDSLLNHGGPTRETDPPPVVANGPTAVRHQEPVREASQRVSPPSFHPANSSPLPSSNDPPPAPPISLMSKS